ncbi:uncharacterized protein LOC129910207 [Episyrphus balteatus]|uniref:uncharacterized protein LOC129910207 n=1 Tax=Episyrphus balteatus TaxID=286459 RepID=UPI00248558A5|nr:uncharacterized protein LOC129910207 [Episyrphus balteatus]
MLYNNMYYFQANPQPLVQQQHNLPHPEEQYLEQSNNVQTPSIPLLPPTSMPPPTQLPPPIPLAPPNPPPIQQMYSLIQTNGRKVYGPPDDWVGPAPSSACELYIRRIPKTTSEHKILEPFLRFGKIYQFRVPIDFVQGIRGYAYVRYTTEEDACCAMEVLNHHFIEQGKTFDIVNSCEKCRLFVSNIPKHLTEEEIESELKTIFPAMQRIHSKGEVRGKDQNQGYVFVNFATHNDALEAKKRTCPGIIRLWGNDLKVVWANSESVDNTLSNKTLFVRNVDLKLNNRDLIDVIVKHVPRTTIRKISKVRTNAFVDFTCRQAAETVMQKLQGIKVGDQKFVIEWAKPSAQQSLHRMRNSDFDALLRLKCIANNWYIPVIIFGTYFEKVNIQYAAVLLRRDDCPLRFIIVTLLTKELVDIHARLCEVVVTLIDKIGGFPDCNYVFWVQRDTAHLLGAVNPNPHMAFIASHRVPKEFKLDLIEVIDLSWACAMLSKGTEKRLLQLYQQSFLVHDQFTFLTDFIFTQRIFGTIMPKYRSKPPLKYNLNDSQIVLALCYQVTGSNCSFAGREYNPWELTALDCGHNGLPFMTMTLLPLSLTQSRFATPYVLHQVIFGGTSYYSPAQSIMAPPLWISGVSYSESLKQIPSVPMVLGN